ncbi:MAG: hypothetical protein DRJ05_01215 [Bacteroidetes bacterium]|nr:MAG: hypothetical protein DRJ05_01215 [Bacteroidota bacterium]
MRKFTKLGIAFLFTVFATGMLSAQHSAMEIAAKQQTLLQVLDESPIKSHKVVNTTDEQWDVLYSFSAQAASCQAVATDGENFYMTYWNGAGLFDKFDMEGNYIESFTIGAANAIRDFAYDGEYFYGAPSGGMSIAQLDLANQTLVSTIPISGTAGVTGSRHLSYDPGLDGGNGGFWLGQWTELAAVDMEGNTLISNSETPAVESCYGSAYDNYSSPGSPILWLYTQVAGASTLDLVMLEEFDITTLSFTGNNMDLFTISGDIPGYIPGTSASSTIAGGAVTYIDANNKFVLAVNFQQDPNLVAGLELATAGPGLDDDVNVAGILSPTTGIMLGVEDVIVKVKNLGANSQSNIPFEVNVDGGLFYSGTVAGPLAQGESEEVNCGTIDMSAVGTTWQFEACTMMTGDENPDNDCKSKTVTHLAPSYCDATTGSEDEIIGHVVCGTIDNTSGWQGGVADYTDQSTAIDVGGSEDITVTNTGGLYSADITYVWVDWNDDFVFEQGGDEEFQLENVGGTGETFTGSITVPASATEGLHRMRVRMTYSTAPEPCGDASWGEVEDYSILVGENPYPAPTNLTATIFGDDDDDVALAWDAPVSGTPDSYDVYRDGSVITNVTTTTYDDMDLAADTYEYCVTAIYSDGESACSNTSSVTIEGFVAAPPVGLTSMIDGGNIVLNWFAPGGGGGEDFFEDFEAGTLPTGWMAIDNDGDGYNWENSMESAQAMDAYEGDGCMGSASFVNDPGVALTPDNYLITPAIEIGAASILSYYHDAQDEAWADDFYYVKLSTTGTDLGDFTEILWSGTTPTDWAEVTIDLSAYAGNMCYIAFQHTECTDWFWMKLDNVAVTNTKTQSLFTPSVAAPVNQGMPFRTSGMSIDEIKDTYTNYSTIVSTKELTGYNVYHNIDGGAFTVLGTTTETTYTHEGPGLGVHCYYVTAVYDEGESVGTSETCQTIVGIQDIIGQSISIFPNPASDFVNIQSDFDITDVNIYNYAGQVVKTENVNAKVYQVNTAELSQGIYFFQINTVEGIVSKRIIIE